MAYNPESNTTEVSFNPTMEELREIEQWLYQEELRTGKGFYCNWTVIENAYNTKRFITVKQCKKSVGFAVWYENNYIADIEIAEIKPGLREKGLGRFLIENLIESLQFRNVFVVKVHCQPSNSEKAWKKMEFIEYPDVEAMKGFSTKYGKHLYRILTPTTLVSSGEKNQSGELIKLWSEERYRIKDIRPQWIWQLEFEPGTRKLNKPIIHPAFNNWKMTWEINNICRIEDEVKYFPKEIDYGNFIVIQEMPDME
jgi:predicted GNAT family acetyltransferase